MGSSLRNEFGGLDVHVSAGARVGDVASCRIYGNPDDGGFDSFYDPSFTLTPTQVDWLIEHVAIFSTKYKHLTVKE